MQVSVVVGGQYGDEGKGKFVHYLVNDKDIAVVGRGNGGPNAGHNVHDPEKGIEVALHLMPSGVFAQGVTNIVGDGCVINPHLFVKEMDLVEAAGASLTPQSLMLSTRCHVILQTHRNLDMATDKVGSTAMGVGPSYRDKATRVGLRLEVFLRSEWQQTVRVLMQLHNKQLSDLGANELVVNIDTEIELLEKSVQQIRPYITDTVTYLAGKQVGVLAEGAQATMLDTNHGTYPYVTSSSATAGGIVLGLGVPPTAVKRSIGVFKLPMTRVGKGPFTTRLDENEQQLQAQLAGTAGNPGAEFGATTGRARQIGWMDTVMARHVQAVNGFTDLGLTKLDMLSGIPTLKVCTSYMLNDQELTTLPADTEDIQKCTPVYTELSGWDEDIAGVTDWKKLPDNAQAYVQFIESEIGVKATMIGTGPNNADMIIR